MDTVAPFFDSHCSITTRTTLNNQQRCQLRISVYDFSKRLVFSLRRKIGSDGTVAVSWGRSFNVQLTRTTHRPTTRVISTELIRRM